MNDQYFELRQFDKGTDKEIGTIALDADLSAVIDVLNPSLTVGVKDETKLKPRQTRDFILDYVKKSIWRLVQQRSHFELIQYVDDPAVANTQIGIMVFESNEENLLGVEDEAFHILELTATQARNLFLDYLTDSDWRLCRMSEQKPKKTARGSKKIAAKTSFQTKAPVDLKAQKTYTRPIRESYPLFSDMPTYLL